MTKIENLYAIREHLKTAIEGDRVLLANMWEAGTRSGWRFDKINERRELSMMKLDRVNYEICPFPQTIKN